MLFLRSLNGLIVYTKEDPHSMYTFGIFYKVFMCLLYFSETSKRTLYDLVSVTKNVWQSSAS